MTPKSQGMAAHRIGTTGFFLGMMPKTFGMIRFLAGMMPHRLGMTRFFAGMTGQTIKTEKDVPYNPTKNRVSHSANLEMAAC